MFFALLFNWFLREQPALAPPFVGRRKSGALREGCAAAAEWPFRARRWPFLIGVAVVLLAACESGNSSPTVVAPSPAEAGSFRKALEKCSDEACAAKLAQERCERGEAEACARLGEMYTEEGDGGVEKDVRAAASLLMRACDNGVWTACQELAFLSKEERVRLSRNLVQSLYERSCEHGLPESCFTLGEQIFQSRRKWEAGPSEYEYRRGIELLEKACAGKLGLACRVLSIQYEKDIGVPFNPGKALDFVRKACSLGDKESCLDLAARLYGGIRGVSQDRDRAVSIVDSIFEYSNNDDEFKLFISGKDDEDLLPRYTTGEIRKRLERGSPHELARYAALHDWACRNGNGESCSNMAEVFRMKEFGSITRDFDLAFEFAGRAWRLGSPRGGMIGAEVLWAVENPGRSPSEAAQLYQQICDSAPTAIISIETGAENPCFLLARKYESGEELPRNDGLVAKLYGSACANGKGIDRACAYLAFLYERGRGVVKDSKRATELYKYCPAGRMAIKQGKEIVDCHIGGGYGYGRGAGGLGGRRGKAPQIRSSAAMVKGSLAIGFIRFIIKANYQRFEQCYRNSVPGAGNEQLTVSVKFIIGGMGRIQEAAIADEYDPKLADMGECVRYELGKLRFPSPEGGGIVIVTYPFRFGEGN